MAKVEITPGAAVELAACPRPIQFRIYEIFNRLTKWPDISGAKPLRGDLHGNYRIRTGDYRVVFRVRTATRAADTVVVVWKIGNRGDVYD